MTRPQDSFRAELVTPDENGEGQDLLCRIPLRIEASPGMLVPVRFRVDTGSTRTLMALATAEEYDFPIPDASTEKTIRLRRSGGQSSAVRVRDGRLRLWWGLHPTGDAFDWPVTFLVDAPANATPLLGLGGVIRDCRWVFDGTPDEDAAFGSATFHDIRTTPGV